MSLSGWTQYANRSLRLPNLIERRTMKKVICAIALSGLISVGLLAPSSSGKVRPAPSISIPDLLRAHGVSQEANVLTSYASEAWKVMPYEGSPDGKSHNFFVRRVSVFVRGESFRYQNVGLDGPITETYLFDGTAYHHTVTDQKGLVNTAKAIGDWQFQLTERRLRMFGLLPFLQQLSDPRTEATYLGRTAAGDDKLEMRNASGSWTLFSDPSGLIQRIEARGETIVFSDYRSVEGLRLPFNERVLVEGKPFYELSFTKIEPRPTLDIDFVNPSDLSKQVAR